MNKILKGLSNGQFYKCLSREYKGFPGIDVIILMEHVLGVPSGYLLGFQYKYFLRNDDVYYEKVCTVDGLNLFVERKKPTTEISSKYTQSTTDIFMLRATLDFTNPASPYSPVNIAPSEYIFVNGILYQGEYSPNNVLGFNYSINEYINNLAKETSYIQDLTFEAEEDIHKLSEAAQYLKNGLRQIRKNHRLIRGYFGALGTLSPDNYILLCYLLGHSQQTK